MELTKSMIQWLASGRRGVSSETMFTHLTGVECRGGWMGDYPHDPSDLMRCERLLRQCPELRAELHRMAELGPVWATLVADWDSLVALVIEEAPDWMDGTGCATKAYERMREIIDNEGRLMTREHEPDADQFRQGDVWMSSRGFLYRVVEVERGGQATLRAGATESGGRIVRKAWDGIGWWTRVSCGGAA